MHHFHILGTYIHYLKLIKFMPKIKFIKFELHKYGINNISATSLAPAVKSHKSVMTKKVEIGKQCTG